MDTFKNQMIQELQNMGFLKENITHAVDLAACVRCLKLETPDIIISDWNLPDGTGFDLLKKVKTVDNFKDIPFILCTTISEINNILDAVAAGAAEYIVKPWVEEELRKKIKVAITLIKNKK